MRYWLAPLVLLTACTANPSVAGKPACAAASPEVRRAIEQQIEGHVPGACPNCVDVSLSSSNRVLERNRPAAVDCLTEIFETGYETAGMWNQPVAAPANRDWVLPLVAYLDRTRGRALFEAVAKAEPEELRSMWAKANAVKLGNRAYVAELTAFLAVLPNPIGAEAVHSRVVGGEALEALSAADYAEAVDTIRSMIARGYPDPRLAVYEAQFSRDSERLKELVRPGPTGRPALQALAAMGDRAAVEEIARTPAHLLSADAQRIVSEWRSRKP